MTFSKVCIQTASPVQILRCGVFPLRNGCSLLVPCKSDMTVHRAWIMQQSLYVAHYLLLEVVLHDDGQHDLSRLFGVVDISWRTKGL